MRLFIAFDVSDEAKHYFLSLQEHLPDAKITLSKHFHLTLKFLGDVDDNKVDEIKGLLSNIEFDSFTAKTSELGVFPNENMIRVAWVGLEPKDKIIELQKKIESALVDIFPKDDRFHPHITLARVKFVEDKIGFMKNIKQIQTKEIEFPVNSFKLIKSTLTPEGPVYEVVAVFKAQPTKTKGF